MTKDRFLSLLRERSSGLPQDELEERLSFYEEAIDDRMEEGLSEEKAVFAMGSIDEIAAQLAPDVKLSAQKRRIKAWELVLLVLGSPVWLSLLIAALAVVIALHVSLWSVIVSLWAVFVSVAACVIGCVAIGICFICVGSGLSGAAVIASAVICAGCAILMFFGCKAATKSILRLTKNIAVWLKLRFSRVEGVR